MKKLILASQSPRRVSLLKDAGFNFECHPANISETPNKNLTVDEQIIEIARRKAQAIFEGFKNTDHIILAADTEVVLNSQTLGKPNSPEHAIEILEMLSDQTHHVKTGICILDCQTGQRIEHLETTEIKFKKLDLPTIKDYVASGEPLDKAGAYGIQGLGKDLVARVQGGLDNVVGLPVSVVTFLLEKHFLFYSPLADFLQKVPKEKIIAVSKKKTSEDIRALYKTGFRNFGENYVQEALEKKEQLKDLNDIKWHFIGHLQSNKVKNIIGKFDLIHSIDSAELIAKVDSEAKKISLTQKVLLQIMMVDEKSKFGLTLIEAEELLQKADQFKNVEIKGVMLMPPPDLSMTELRQIFSATKKWAHQNFKAFLPILSMGTSQDFKIALEEGADYIRIGTLLFGSRN